MSEGMVGEVDWNVLACFVSLFVSSMGFFGRLQWVCSLTESMAGDQRDGGKGKVCYGCQQREETGAVGGRVGIGLVEF